MLYIKTNRGWRPLHKSNYRIADTWQRDGLNIDEKVAALNAHQYWFTERNYNSWEVKNRLLNSAKHRAKKSSLKFSIGPADFDIPLLCPLRHVLLKVGNEQHTEDSPTLDRKDPRFGYIKGNVWVISHKANRLKGNLTPDELRTLCENVLALNWVTWTSDDEHATRKQENAKQKARWWALWGKGPKS
ncbi:hypothetical protein [Pseudolabrys sp. FHR47]|uniref:hypothetical protein n=1 Tax=Pseudolabrys sp. FHR47 TaxID=2562284 RepID=UPI0010BF0BB2|nr:hypothetical protein [Pseudolabrys sp. FHR47]